MFVCCRVADVGTLLVQPSDCFIHWRDVETGHEWGLNFTTASDARQFRDCCMVGADTYHLAINQPIKQAIIHCPKNSNYNKNIIQDTFLKSTLNVAYAVVE